MKPPMWPSRVGQGALAEIASQWGFKSIQLKPTSNSSIPHFIKGHCPTKQLSWRPIPSAQYLNGHQSYSITTANDIFYHLNWLVSLRLGSGDREAANHEKRGRLHRSLGAAAPWGHLPPQRRAPRPFTAKDARYSSDADIAWGLIGSPLLPMPETVSPPAACMPAGPRCWNRKP